MNEMLEMLMDYGTRLALMVAAGLVIGLFQIAREYLTVKIGAARMEQIERAAATTVRGLEQQGVIAGWDGEYKKALATLSLRAMRDTLKIQAVDNDMIDLLVEANVQLMNAETVEVRSDEP
jgi:hypothetical protein